MHLTKLYSTQKYKILRSKRNLKVWYLCGKTHSSRTSFFQILLPHQNAIIFSNQISEAPPKHTVISAIPEPYLPLPLPPPNLSSLF